jgi:hypothetical protein
MESEMRKMALVAEWVFFLAIAAVIMSVILVVKLYNQPPPTLSLANRIENPKVKAGGDLVIHNIFNRPVDCASWWHRYIFSESGIQVQGFSEYRPADTTEAYIRAIRIPPITPPGDYFYEATIVWHCNWVQTLVPKEEKLPTIKITVVK